MDFRLASDSTPSQLANNGTRPLVWQIEKIVENTLSALDDGVTATIVHLPPARTADQLADYPKLDITADGAGLTFDLPQRVWHFFRMRFASPRLW